jgi:broad specificity phosphatase PhoE
MAKITIYFIRHAESEANASDKDLIGGHNLDVKLTPKGKMQAQALGVAFKQQGITFTKAYSSTAVRTQETAKTCFEAMGCNLTLSTTERLLEHDAGDWAGQSRAIYQRLDVRKDFDTDPWHRISGDVVLGESQEMVAIRITKWVQELNASFADSEEEQHIAVFTHGLAIKCFIADQLNLDKMTAVSHKVNPVDNASITQFCYQNNALVFEKANFIVPELALVNSNFSSSKVNETVSKDSANPNGFFQNPSIDIKNPLEKRTVLNNTK